MLKIMSRNILRICMIIWVIATSALFCPGQQGMDEKHLPLEESKIWGWWPRVPWDKEPVAASAWPEVLNQPITIIRTGKPGDKNRYQIKRINLTLDRQGKVVSRITAEGELFRELSREAEPGIWIENCKWERFAAAQGMGPKDYPDLQELPDARGVSFEFSPRTFDYINPPADFTRLEDEALGYLLKILTIDAISGDSILLAIHNRFGSKVHIGDTWRQTEWKPWEITYAGSKEPAVSYHAGEMQISIVGLTRFSGEPCVLVWFSMEGNSVIHNMETPQLTLKFKSTEYFRGELAASLLDGRLVAVELWGPLPCIMEMGIGGKSPAEQPFGAIIQQVCMWEIPSTPQKKKSNP
jgi:hypothetical protein